MGGSDTICARRGHDTIAGDTLEVAFTESADISDAATVGDTIFGGRGADTIYGSEAADTIHAGRGEDTVMGNGGDDDIYGGLHHDTIHGGQGNDTIRGNFGQDIIAGGPGNDRIYGGQHADTVDGGEGDDHIFGGRGNDELSGGAGTADITNGNLGIDNCDAEKINNCENTVELVSVADVVGENSMDAQATLDALGLTSSITEVFSDADMGTVISQNPEAGTQVDAGSDVALTVSKGPNNIVSLANVVGQSVGDATATLESLGLSVNVTEVFNEAPEGTVLSQDPAAGENVELGSVVSLEVSKGLELLTTTIEGFVSTPDSSIINNAQITSFVVGNVETEWFYTSSGSLGSYSLEVPRDTQFVTTVSAEGYTDQVIQTSSSSSSAAAQFDIVMKE